MRGSRFALFFAVIVALMLSACSGSKPESVIETFYTAVAKNDADLALKQISLSEVPSSSMAMATDKLKMLVEAMSEKITENGGLKKIEILDVTLNSDKTQARVKSKLIFKNGQELPNNDTVIKDGSSWKILIK